MFCPHCGKQVNDGDVFCNSCGKAINNNGTPGTATQTGKKSSKTAIILIAAVAVIAVALGIFNLLKDSNEITPTSPRAVSEISSMYKGLAGNNQYLYFDNSPDNSNIGLYVNLFGFSDEEKENNAFVFTGSWILENGKVTTYNDSILELQSASIALGGETTDYSGTAYTLYGDYLFAEEDMFKGNIPDNKKFDAVCTDGYTTYTFNKNGTYTRENEKISETGKYSRSDSIITLTPNDSDKVKELFVYNGDISCFAYKKCRTDDAEFEKLNSLAEKDTKTAEKVKASLIKETINTLKYSFDVNDVDVSCNFSVHSKDTVVYIGYATFALEFGDSSDLLRLPIKFTISLSDSDGEIKYYSDAVTIGGLTREEIEAFTNP